MTPPPIITVTDDIADAWGLPMPIASPAPLPIGFQILGRYVLPEDGIPESFDQFMAKAHDLATRLLIHHEPFVLRGHPVAYVDASELLAFRTGKPATQYNEAAHYARMEAFWFGMATMYVLMREMTGRER